MSVQASYLVEQVVLGRNPRDVLVEANLKTITNKIVVGFKRLGITREEVDLFVKSFDRQIEKGIESKEDLRSSIRYALMRASIYSGAFDLFSPLFNSPDAILGSSTILALEFILRGLENSQYEKQGF